MHLTGPTILTLLRIALIPVLVLVFYLPFQWSNIAAVTVFVLASLTDWADGYLARRTGQTSRFGEFLDPVADKLMVTTALILLVQAHASGIRGVVFTLAAVVIVGRELTVSALREWMSELGERALVGVSWIGKFKTGFQMTAIGFLLYREDLAWIPVPLIGELLLYIAAGLTLWSMFRYMQAAWPTMKASHNTEPLEIQDSADSADLDTH